MILNPETDLTITRYIAVPPAKVWAAWADPVELAKWWCPKPWITEVKAFDFRSGGAFHTLMRGPNEGEVSDNPGGFVLVVPHEQIVFSSNIGEDWRPAPPSWMPMTAIFTLAPENGGTRYTATVLHPDAATRAQHVEMGFYDGWTTCMNQLAELVES